MREELLSVLDIRSGGEHGDHHPYGALCAMFDIAHALYWLDPNSVPAAWGFRPAPAGSPDYAECTEGDGDGCPAHSGECWAAYALLTQAGVNLSDPYGDEHGLAAERALVELGTELHPYARLSDV